MQSKPPFLIGDVKIVRTAKRTKNQEYRYLKWRIFNDFNVEKSQIFDFSVFYSFLLRTNFATRCTPVHRRVPQSRGFGLSLCVPNNFTYPLMVGCLKTLFLNSLDFYINGDCSLKLNSQIYISVNG